MNIGVITCLIMAGAFFVMAIIFVLLKEKGAMLISGFNTLPKEQREKYDKLRMSNDMRNLLFLWSVLYVIGAVLSYVFSSYMSVMIIVVWLILFFKEVHLDTEKAFGKYQL